MSTVPQPRATGEFFDYFSAIEQRFNARRGSLLLLSTLDWALIETWREAGVPLEAVLRGVDASFDRYEARAQRAAGSRSRLRRVNGLAWCAQAVMEATEQIVDASTGLPAANPREAPTSGFEVGRVTAYLRRNARMVEAAQLVANISAKQPASAALQDSLATTAVRLQELSDEVETTQAFAPEELDRTLTLLEERLLAALRSATSEAELAAFHAAADYELGSARARLGAAQARRVRDQFVQKRLLEALRLPRLSLFYMGMEE